MKVSFMAAALLIIGTTAFAQKAPESITVSAGNTTSGRPVRIESATFTKANGFKLVDAVAVFSNSCRVPAPSLLVSDDEASTKETLQIKVVEMGSGKSCLASYSPVQVKLHVAKLAADDNRAILVNGKLATEVKYSKTEALINALKGNPVVSAALRQAEETGTPACKFEVKAMAETQNDGKVYVYEARIICNSKNKDEMGAGQMLIDLKGGWNVDQPIIDIDLSVRSAG